MLEAAFIPPDATGTTSITITLPLAELQETVEVTSSTGAAVAVSTEGRVADNFGKNLTIGHTRATVAVDVCILPPASVEGTLWTL